MSGRASILTAIKANKPALIAMPELNIEPVNRGISLAEQFARALESIGGKTIMVEGYGSLREVINSDPPNGRWIVNMVPGITDENREINPSLNAAGLEAVHTAYIPGTLAVAENGAIWVKESQAVNRLLPFICQHLVLVVSAGAIVSTLHDAYRVLNVAEEGYGVFIAGPSKTADIEQSLVIGAHGARSLTVYLVD